MPVSTIVVSRLAAGATQRTDLEKLFGSPAFLFFKEMVASHAIVHQVEAMNAALYPENEDAMAKFEGEKKKAADFNRILDMLDDFTKKEDQWFTVKLDRINE